MASETLEEKEGRPTAALVVVQRMKTEGTRHFLVFRAGRAKQKIESLCCCATGVCPEAPKPAGQKQGENPARGGGVGLGGGAS